MFSFFDPVVLFFVLGLFAGIARVDLRLPPAIYELLSTLLLLSIGLKGGIEMARQPVGDLVPQIAVIVLAGLVLPLIAFPVLRWLGRLSRADSASIAAHYGSVSVGTYAVAVAYLSRQNVEYEAYMPLFVAVLEVPAIVVGVLLARGLSRQTQWGPLAHEVFLGKSVVLLGGGIFIGWATGPELIQPLAPLFFDLFAGVLALFLLEMGLIASRHLGSLRRRGLFLLGFALIMPLVSAAIGLIVGYAIGLSVGGTALLATLFASASYIAVPAAMRISVPQANPALSLTAVLGFTFPFNILVGIPIYLEFANWVHS